MRGSDIVKAAAYGGCLSRENIWYCPPLISHTILDDAQLRDHCLAPRGACTELRDTTKAGLARPVNTAALCEYREALRGERTDLYDTAENLW